MFGRPDAPPAKKRTSIAMLLHDRLKALNRPINVRIFATDVHRGSLDTAAAGIYGETSVANLSPSRLETYFTRVKDGYKISPDLRNLVVFRRII